MNTVNEKNPLLSSSGSGDISGSFKDETFPLNDGTIKQILKQFEIENVISQTQLKARLFTILIENQERVHVYLGSINFESQSSESQKFVTHFYPFLVQAEKNFYILVSSDFDIYKHVNQEPFLLQDTLEEFQSGLKKCLGLKYGMAYHGTNTEEMVKTETERSGIVAVIQTHFDQITEKNHSYILFTL